MDSENRNVTKKSMFLTNGAPSRSGSTPGRPHIITSGSSASFGLASWSNENTIQSGFIGPTVLNWPAPLGNSSYDLGFIGSALVQPAC